jgi:hypothetical protein
MFRTFLLDFEETRPRPWTCGSGRKGCGSSGQASLENLFVIFMMFLLIAAIYQMFMIHNTLFQMAANAYYDSFKEARDKNSKDNSFTTDIHHDLKLSSASGGDPHGVPIINLFQQAGSYSVNASYYIGSGTEGNPFDIQSMSPSVSQGNQQAPPCQGSCSCSMNDSDGNSHSVGEMQAQWIHDHPGVEPSFPHTRVGYSKDCDTCPMYLHFGLTSTCY